MDMIVEIVLLLPDAAFARTMFARLVVLAATGSVAIDFWYTVIGELEPTGILAVVTVTCLLDTTGGFTAFTEGVCCCCW